MPCFENCDVNTVINKFSERFMTNKSDNDFIKLVNDIVNQSCNNFWTNQYDKYQKMTNGILP
jgi:phosphatidylinositol kinase/protein kinase (PI-3  family)